LLAALKGCVSATHQSGGTKVTGIIEKMGFPHETEFHYVGCPYQSSEFYPVRTACNQQIPHLAVSMT
jgi:hypothetical protein